ncbi:GNAT family N-acetyltransferase [Cytobacillus purgationiresistens]|uniref:GNAT superfamily acetyltransferase n=1 Tax=Cytobacillus purgationiresistens TaxID=863449 RepID=A0ABU0ABF8_9BACI|nr:GNAT family N-acetyltransferase [Cytobacillus purgationiresistens]MDQ0268365.1 putative GNAT superfamily acetyltransferase [Cytobacillus purgationiresistens]
MNDGITIRTLKTVQELHLIQELESEVWEMNPIPIHQTITAVKNGGIMLGAFYEGELVGFSYGFPGFDHGKSFLCSHMLGIHRDHRDKGIGALLKEEQKQVAIQMGYDLIRWTFDPLQSRNAYLNLSKLNGICSDYVENCYGEMEDGINQGLPSDRFNIEWWIASEHVNETTKDEINPISPFEWENGRDGFPRLKETERVLQSINLKDEAILVPIPLQFQEMKEASSELALKWRIETRKIFQHLFQKGYAAISLKKDFDNGIGYMHLLRRDLLKLEK